MELKRKIYEILTELGVTDDLEDAIFKCYNDFTCINGFCDKVYAVLGEKYCNNPQNIERAMRHAIENVFDKKYNPARDKYFIGMVDEDGGRVLYAPSSVSLNLWKRVSRDESIQRI